MEVALLGTGLMGTPMARNLAAAGHELHVWNRSYEKAALLADCAQVYKLPTEAVARAEIVIPMLFDGPVTSAVLPFRSRIFLSYRSSQAGLVLEMSSQVVSTKPKDL